MHIPVLLEEALRVLEPRPGEFMIDGTADGGGHAAALLERIGTRGMLLALDWDAAMADILRRKFSGAGRSAIVVQGNYADLPEILRERGLPKADGLLLDLGFSSLQLEESGRGFSLEKDEPLRMTYDDTREPASGFLNRADEEELCRAFREFGEERFAKRIARAIVKERKKEPILSTSRLRTIILRAVPGNYERGRIDPATRTFQALRIAANGELQNLRRIIERAGEVLKPGGRFAVISFHSLEDRIVKQGFATLAKKGIFEPLTKKPVMAGEEERRKNPRSRSAKLRGGRFI